MKSEKEAFRIMDSKAETVEGLPGITFEALVENLDDAIITANMSGDITSWNRGAERIFGYKAENMIGKRIFDFYPIPVREDRAKWFNELMAGGDIKDLRTRIHRADGSPAIVSVSLAMLRNDKGEPIGTVEISRDITKQVQTEENTSKTLSLLSATLESTADGILVVDNRRKITNFNQKLIEMFHIPQSVLASRDEGRVRDFIIDQLKDPGEINEKIEKLYKRPDTKSHGLLEFKDGRVFERYSQPQLIGGKIVGRVWSFRDITERKQAEDKLKKVYDELKVFDKLKDAFLSNVSHELKTPLMSIEGVLDLMAEADLSKEHAELISMARRNANRLGTLIEDILQVARIEDEVSVLKKEEFDLGNMIASSVKIISPRAQDGGIDIETSLDGDLKVIADKKAIYKVLSNLLNNAIKFNKAGGKVIVRARAKVNNRVEVCIEDTGIGITKEHLSKVFDRFYQVDASTRRNYGGTGLGLSIAKSILEKHAGGIWVESEFGKGSKFTFELPRVGSYVG